MVRRQREKRQNGQKGDKRFEGESAALVKGGQVEQWRYTGLEKSEEEVSVTMRCNGGSHSVIRDTAGGSSRSESCQEL